MKILVAIKRVVDFKTIVRLKADGSDVDTSNVKMAMNPFDEIAVEEAVRLKEKGIANEVIVLSIGHESALETIRNALAMGADRGILVKHTLPSEPLLIAKILHYFVQQEQIQLAILGKQAIDSDDNQTGQMLAALWQCAQGTFASKIEVQAGGVYVTREIDGGLETLFLTLPAVITTDLRLNEPRYLSLPNIVKAKQKPITQVEFAHLGITHPSQTTLLKVSIPQRKRAQIKVNNVDELLSYLKQDGVIK